MKLRHTKNEFESLVAKELEQEMQGQLHSNVELGVEPALLKGGWPYFQKSTGFILQGPFFCLRKKNPALRLSTVNCGVFIAAPFVAKMREDIAEVLSTNDLKRAVELLNGNQTPAPSGRWTVPSLELYSIQQRLSISRK